LSNDLILKYGKRSVSLREGDTVKIVRGAAKGKSGKVLNVDRGRSLVSVEGFTIAKADGTQKERWVRPSNLLITKLNLQDPWRRRKLGLGGVEEKEEVEELESQAEEEGIEGEDSDV